MFFWYFYMHTCYVVHTIPFVFLCIRLDIHDSFSVSGYELSCHFKYYCTLKSLDLGTYVQTLLVITSEIHRMF